MKKRPFLFMAVFMVFFCFIFKILNLNSYYDLEYQKTVNIKAKLIKIEEKGYSDYLFVNADKFGRAIIVAPKNSNLKIGQTFVSDCKTIDFNKARNFGNFNEEEYYKSLGYGYKFKLNKINEVSENYDYLRQKIYEFRKKIISVFDETLSSSKAGIFKAIVVGDKSNIEEDTKELFQKNGIAHILAISGLHISLIGMTIYSLINRKFSIITSGIISSLIMILFCIMSGESVSAVRATIMFVLRMIAIMFGKSFDILSALSFSGIVILISNPLYLFNTSFQLSFLAILGIAVLAKYVQNFLLVESNSKIKIALISSVSVFLLTIPVIANSYFEISLYSIFLNLIVIPLMSFILGSALFSATLGFISITISRFVIGMGVLLLDAINVLCFLADKFPLSVIVTGNLSVSKIILFYGLLVLFLLFIFIESKRDKKNINIVKRLIICGITFALLIFIVFIKIPDNKLNICFFDVDQGDGILIRTPNNTVVMIDGGSTSVADVKEYRLESAIKYKKVSQIDYAIVTHPDTDHISGLLAFINDNSAGSIKIKGVYIPQIKENENYELLKKACEDNNISFNNIYSGIYLEENGLKISCLHPDKCYANAKSINAYSTVLELEYGKFNALFVGDLEDDGERILAKQGVLHKYDLLKVSHHGSRNSTSEDFLKIVFPKIAIISAGVNNSYGHPHKETLERLKNVGSEIYCTADSGEVDLTIDRQGNVVVKTKL